MLMLRSTLNLSRPMLAAHFHAKHIPSDLPPHTTTTEGHPKYLSRTIYNPKDLENLKPVHIDPVTLADRFASFSVKAFTFPFEDLKKVFEGDKVEQKVFRRAILFESLAVTPAMIAANYLHFRGIRKRINYGDWINTLLEEAENEKIHLFVFLELYKPTLKNKLEIKLYHYLYRLYFALLYRISPKIAHKVIGYIEEEAVNSYTKILHAIDSGALAHWKQIPAPKIAQEYWSLPETATMRDVVLVIRADEAFHREANHYFSGMKLGSKNEFDKLAKLAQTDFKERTMEDVKGCEDAPFHNPEDTSK